MLTSECRICNSDELIPVLDLGTQAITSVFPIRRSTTPSMSAASLSSPSTEAPHRTQTAS